MDLTWLDNNSWLIDLDNVRILLDPWLVGPLTVGNQEWLLKVTHRTPPAIPDEVDLILLSQGLEDHAHVETLKALDKSIPVVCSPNAVSVVTELDYSSVTALAHGETYTHKGVSIQAFPGSPIGPFLTENAYMLTGQTEGTRLYYEPHGFHAPALADLAPVDVAIAPLMTVKLPLVGAIIQGQESAVGLARSLQLRYLLPTGAGQAVDYAGLLPSLLKGEGGPAECRALLAQAGLATEVLEPKPGDRLSISPASSPATPSVAA
ncbi:MAG: MBL fold metallo-hydrolase [Thermoleptolyngbya sp. C42_A2020_037]|nr:MBL fold metallo-hydrolase [Thermoleptolyngbya sp. C42_A2020_037]